MHLSGATGAGTTELVRAMAESVDAAITVERTKEHAAELEAERETKR
jgi:hypothetical protein